MEQMLKRVETCLYPTGSVSPTLDLCESLLFVVPFFHNSAAKSSRVTERRVKSILFNSIVFM